MDRSDSEATVGGAGADDMPTTLQTAAESYLRAKALSRRTRSEYLSTLRTSTFPSHRSRSWAIGNLQGFAFQSNSGLHYLT